MLNYEYFFTNLGIKYKKVRNCFIIKRMPLKDGLYLYYLIYINRLTKRVSKIRTIALNDEEFETIEDNLQWLF